MSTATQARAAAALRLCTAALALCTWAGPSQAELSPGGNLPKLLENIKQAKPGMCQRDEAGGARGADAPPAVPEPDLSCALGAREAAQLSGKPGAAFIDTRDAAQHQAFHIANAVNAQVYELRSKPYWKNKRVVLIGSGKNDAELYSACAALKAQGYQQVQVLRGGMAAWVAGGLPTLGNEPSVDDLTRLSAPELWAEATYEDNVVLVARQQSSMLPGLHASVTVDLAAPDAVKSALARRRKELKNAPLASVVVVAAPGTKAELIARWRQSIEPVPLLAYAGTSEAYRRYLTQQKAAWAAQARGPKQPGCKL